ncbi:MAG: hypothetical protein JO057_07925 [Chloroflexi bacterium]|nr:hypothetical protein [Chloroflexota bacterium]
MRPHRPGAEHIFSARFHTDGTFTNLSRVRLESDDQNYLENYGHDLVTCHHTHDGIDGVNVDIEGGTVLTGEADLDSTPISTSDIFLGAAERYYSHRWLLAPAAFALPITR